MSNNMDVQIQARDVGPPSSSWDENNSLRTSHLQSTIVRHHCEFAQTAAAVESHLASSLLRLD